MKINKKYLISVWKLFNEQTEEEIICAHFYEYGFDIFKNIGDDEYEWIDCGEAFKLGEENENYLY